jgi:hypothetical protein
VKAEPSQAHSAALAWRPQPQTPWQRAVPKRPRLAQPQALPPRA